MAQFQEIATVTRTEQLSASNFRLTLDSPQIAKAARPGEFVMIKAGQGRDPLLRRPFSIHQTSADGRLQVYFKVVGKGTEILAAASKGDQISVFGPLGKGFRVVKEKPAVIVAGGLGIAPMLFLAKELARSSRFQEEDLIFLGGRDKSEVAPLVADFQHFCSHLQIATDDGSLGHKGFVTELLQKASLPAGAVVYSCGPEAMMEQVAKQAADKGLECQVSIESVMACGMGACLGCSRPAKDGGYTHVCLNGPVYRSEELKWNI